MERKAKCSCGNLQVELSGDPKMVAACNCLSCQKRTGSVFGVVAYFGNDQVMSTQGEYSQFEDINDEGRKIIRAFCPNCGTTVHWKADFMPNSIGIAVGCFEDSNFPEPTSAAWNRSKHNWVRFPEKWQKSDTQKFQ